MNEVLKICQYMIKIIIYSILNVMAPFYNIIYKIVPILTDKPYFSKKLYTMILMVILFIILVMVSCYTIFKLTNIFTVFMIMVAMFIIFVLYTQYSLVKEYSKNRFYFVSNV